MRYNYLLFVACLTIILLTSCQESKDTHIKIVCTGDVHGNLFPHDFLTGDTTGGSLARVSTYLNTQQRQNTHIVYIDNGDMLQGTPATYCYNTHAIGFTHVAAEALNYLGCDAVVLGNNDIEPGGPTYQRYANELEGTVLGGNIFYKDTATPFLPPYTIVEREGIQIAILGLTTPAIPHWIPQSQWPELEFADMERSARQWMQHIHENASPDIVIGLFHSGYEGGITTADYAENATRAVAEHVKGFDAIFYGHDHQARIDKVVNIEGDTVLLLNPGRDAHHVATLDIIHNKKGRAALNATLVNMGTYPPDPKYMAAFAPQIEFINKYIDRTIGTSDCAAATNDALLGPSAFIDFVHQMQLDISDAKVSFAAPLVYNDTLPKGHVKVRDIYRLFPYENSLYVLWLTGHEIKNYLEYSYTLWIDRMNSPESILSLFNSSQHTFCSFDSAAGILYEVDATKPDGYKVSIHGMADGTPFNMDERYMVVMNSYRANGGGGLLTEGAGITYQELPERIVYTTTADLRFYMLNYIEMHKTITPQSLKHWRFVPEQWATHAKAQHNKALLDSSK
ncbi:MAG: bifunctional metallophosphatase/5'-nucleotidase [Bacteroidaceae bacterium]|nr:bifunctional metallophosphatase/5'-nucleotidase [Bacteroidaceae bacterium]